MDESFNYTRGFVPATETGFLITFPPAWVPLISGILPNLYADFTTETPGGSGGRYWYNGTEYWNFAPWLAAISGTFSRASTAYRTNQFGNLESVNNDVIRFDYDPASLIPKGLLLEGSSTNSALQSNTFNVTWFSTGGGAITLTSAATTAPDGTTTGWALNENATTNTSYGIGQSITASTNQTWTFSIYAKKKDYQYLGIDFVDTGGLGDHTCFFDLTNGVVASAVGQGGTASMINQRNGWYRCSVTITTNNAGTVSVNPQFYTSNSASTFTHAGVVGNGVYVWGAQVEQLSFASSYIPTTTVAVARAADSLTATPINAWYNATNGVLYAASDSNGAITASQAGIVEIDDATSNNRLLLLTTFSTANTAIVTSGGVQQFAANSGDAGQRSQIAGVLTKVAISTAANNFIYVRDVGSADTSASGSMPVSPTTLNIGSNTAAIPLNGHFAQIGYWPTTASAGQLQTLTSPPSWVPTAVGVLPSIFADFAGQNFLVNGWVTPQTGWFNELGATFTRASTAYLTNASGLLTQVGNDILRYDYDPVTLAAKGVLLEGASTNLAVQSQNLAAATWANNNLSSVTGGAADPTGGASAYTLTAAAGNAEHDIRNNTAQALTAGTTYTLSMYVKQGAAAYVAIAEYSQPNIPVVTVKWSDFSLSTNGQLGAVASLSGPTNGFYRLSMTWTATSNANSICVVGPSTIDAATIGNNAIIYNAVGTESVIVFGMQHESLPFASSYIPTTTVTVTRAADNLSGPQPNFINSTASGVGTLFTKISAGNQAWQSGGGRFFSDQFTYIRTTNTTTVTAVFNANSMGSQTVADETINPVKAALSYTVPGNATALSANGGAVSTGISGSYSKTTFTFGAEVGNPGLELFGDMAQFGVWFVTATNTQLQTLTT